MAHIIPTTPSGNLPTEVFHTFRFFKTLSDDYYIWQHLTPWIQEAPDFLLLNKHRQAILVKVSGAHQKDARNTSQMLLLAGQSQSLGEIEEPVLDEFINNLPPALGKRIHRVVLFPNIPQSLLQTSHPANRPSSSIWLGQEAIQNDGIRHWKLPAGDHGLDEIDVEQLRSRFSPEVIVPATLTVRTAEKDRLQAGLTDYLLDYDQEFVVKHNLDLTPEEQTLAKDFRISVVNGVAGSGKSLILLYRLRLLHELFPRKSYLVLTHNRPLIRDLQSRFNTLTGCLPSTINWETFNSWCFHHWPENRLWVEPLGATRRKILIEETWQDFFQNSSITPGELESELDWIKDQVPMNTQGYLNAERHGRGFRLTHGQREQMWSAVISFQKKIRQSGDADWADIPRIVWKAIQESTLRLPIYDVVMVDEAQFFAPIWFDIIRCLVRPQTGHLFIVADPSQGFLGRGASWKSLGLDVRGHTYKLRHSYRTTHEILNFAIFFYRQRITAEDQEEEVLPPDMLNMPHGVLPFLLPLATSQDEITRVAMEIESLIKRGQPPNTILVLHADWEGVENLIGAICKRLGEKAAADPKNELPGDYVRVTTINAGTGLESPIVFLVGLNTMFEREQSLRLSDEEREKIKLENTRKIYMAATRAGQRLIFTYVGPLPEPLKGLLNKAE